jgi:hypothetical protein
MPSGGARNRSGPQPDPQSLTSARRGYVLDALPAQGFDGQAPPFPLPPAVVWDVYYEGDVRHRVRDKVETEARRAREQELWAWAWSTPQAYAWSTQRWRWQTVAMWVRTSALCESSDATAADKNSLHRFADQIGLTPAGLKENGWRIADDDQPAQAGPVVPLRTSARDRLKAVRGGAAAG